MAFYHCILCNHVNTSIEDLHNHYIQYHTPEELSYTIINLQGLKKRFKPIVLGNNNNNECTGDKVTDYDAKIAFEQNERFCLLNHSQFVTWEPWEHELNKRTEISDEDFCNTIEMFCNDLKHMKRKGRKRKNETATSKITADALEYKNKIYIKSELTDTEIEIKSENIFNDFSPENCTPIISSWNTGIPIAHIIIDNEIAKSQIKNETSIENITTFTLPEADTKENILTYDLLNYNLP